MRRAELGPPGLAFHQGVREPEQPERHSRVADAAADHGRPASNPPATIRTSLTKSGEGGRPASAASEPPSTDPSPACVRSTPWVARVPARGSNEEQWCGGVEAGSLSPARGRRCVSRPRRARAEFQSRSRVRSRPCARGWNRRAVASRAVAARGTEPRRPARADRIPPAPRVLSTRRPPAPVPGWRRQATSRTRGGEAAERRAETGAGASECASGSQLCTGAHPIFAARPARRSKYATRVTWPGCTAENSRQESASSPPADDCGCERHDPEQRDAQAERRQDQVFPRRLECARFAAESHEQRRNSGRGFDESSHAPARFPITGMAARIAQNANSSP